MDGHISPNSEDSNEKRCPTLREALGFWWKLGWISFGGTAAHLAIMHSELVEDKQWIDSDHFFRALNHCMLLPGPEAQQLAIYIGWKLHGKVGGLLAGTLFVAPSAVILLVLSLLYAKCGTLPWMERVFSALKPLVVALVLRALFKIGKRVLHSVTSWVVATAAFCVMTVLHVSLPWVMGSVVAVSAVKAIVRHKQLRETQTEKKSSMRKHVHALVKDSVCVVGSCVAIGVLPILCLRILGNDFPFWMKLCGFFTRTAVVTLGGSYTVLPYVAHVAVTKFSWLSHSEMLDGFALAETTPGPLIIVVGFVGFMAGFHYFHQSLTMGAFALALTIFYTFLPCFLFVFAGAPWFERSRGEQASSDVLGLVSPVVVAAILQLAIFLVRGLLVSRVSGIVDSLRALSIVAWLGFIQLVAFCKRRYSVDLFAGTYDAT